MPRGFLNHIYLKLLDNEGVPISNANIRLYEYVNGSQGNTLHTVTSAGVSASNILTTDTDGSFDFYVKDHIRANSEGGWGYTWDTQYVINWSKGSESGTISESHLFGEFESFVPSASNVMNKAISDYIGWTLQDHIDFECGS